MTLPVWADLPAMKQLLCYFRVVFSVDKEMAWDSDLLVPVAWRRRTGGGITEGGGDAQDAVPKIDLTGTTQYQLLIISVHVHWQFQFTQPLPASFFGRLAVKTYSPMSPREIDQHTITYRPVNSFVCAMSMTCTAIHLQSMTLQSETAMWWLFSHVALSIERLLATAPTLVVSRTARNAQGVSIRLETAVASWATSPSDFRATINWLPPDLEWYQAFMDLRPSVVV